MQFAELTPVAADLQDVDLSQKSSPSLSTSTSLLAGGLGHLLDGADGTGARRIFVLGEIRNALPVCTKPEFAAEILGPVLAEAADMENAGGESAFQAVRNLQSMAERAIMAEAVKPQYFDAADVRSRLEGQRAQLAVALEGACREIENALTAPAESLKKEPFTLYRTTFRSGPDEWDEIEADKFIVSTVLGALGHLAPVTYNLRYCENVINAPFAYMPKLVIDHLTGLGNSSKGDFRIKILADQVIDMAANRWSRRNYEFRGEEQALCRAWAWAFDGEAPRL